MRAKAALLVLGLSLVSLAAACSGSGRVATTATSTGRIRGVTTTSTPTTAALSDTSRAAPPPSGPVPLPAGVQVISHVPTSDRVVFLTIDDGLVRDPEFTARFQRAGIPVTIFPIATAEQADPGFFKAWLTAGAELGDHTVTHPNLARLGQAAQRNEICGAGAIAQRLFGRTPTLFRPPYGNHNAATAAAVQACGMRYIILWREAVNEGRVQFQQGSKLQPGDIILMHFRPTFDEDFDAALAQAQADGMRFASLRAYLPE